MDDRESVEMHCECNINGAERVGAATNPMTERSWKHRENPKNVRHTAHTLRTMRNKEEQGEEGHWKQAEKRTEQQSELTGASQQS